MKLTSMPKRVRNNYVQLFTIGILNIFIGVDASRRQVIEIKLLS